MLFEVRFKFLNFILKPICEIKQPNLHSVDLFGEAQISWGDRLASIWLLVSWLGPSPSFGGLPDIDEIRFDAGVLAGL
jgi:hypothetical protein